MKTINCKGYAQAILDKVKATPFKKSLWILSMGDNPACRVYAKGKIKDAEYCGIPCINALCHDDESMAAILKAGNKTESVGGIIIQLPLPDGVNEDYYIRSVVASKDVDGFRSDSPFKPCTPEGIMYILHKEVGNISGKTALVIGKGKLVGKPIVDMLLSEGCTVTIAHSKTTNLDELLTRHDIIISAAGKANLVDLKKCKAQVVVDVGINYDENGKLCGDCYNFDENDGSDMKVTPVPGGIGLMTRAMLMAHTVRLEIE